MLVIKSLMSVSFETDISFGADLLHKIYVPRSGTKLWLPGGKRPARSFKNTHELVYGMRINICYSDGVQSTNTRIAICGLLKHLNIAHSDINGNIAVYVTNVRQLKALEKRFGIKLTEEESILFGGVDSIAPSTLAERAAHYGAGSVDDTEWERFKTSGGDTCF